MSCNLYGSQTIAPYSSVERTRAMYDNLLHSSGQYFRFRRRNPSVEFAFFHNVSYMGFSLQVI